MIENKTNNILLYTLSNVLVSKALVLIYHVIEYNLLKRKQYVESDKTKKYHSLYMQFIGNFSDFLEFLRNIEEYFSRY